MTTYPTDQYSTAAQERVLRRCPHHRIIGGVAAGVADYLDVDVAAVRIGFAALTLLAGVGLPLYVAAWVLLPEEGSDISIGEELADRVGLR
jgi:phage shock protein C